MLAGNGKPGWGVGTRLGGKSPSMMGRRHTSELIVAKGTDSASRKAAIVYPVPVP